MPSSQFKVEFKTATRKGSLKRVSGKGKPVTTALPTRKVLVCKY